MLAVPLLALIDLHWIPGPSLFVSVFLALFMLNSGRHQIVGAEMIQLLPALFVGTLIGAATLTRLPSHLLGTTFAVLILMAVAVTVLIKPIQLTKGALVGGGLAAGLMGTVSGIHGPPLAVLYQREPIEKTRATMALVFTIGYVLSLTALMIAGQFTLDSAYRGLSLLPGLTAGFWLARRYKKGLSPSIARVSMLLIATASAVILLVTSNQT